MPVVRCEESFQPDLSLSFLHLDATTILAMFNILESCVGNMTGVQTGSSKNDKDAEIALVYVERSKRGTTHLACFFKQDRIHIFWRFLSFFLTLFFKQVSALTVVATAKSCAFSSISLCLEVGRVGEVVGTFQMVHDGE